MTILPARLTSTLSDVAGRYRRQNDTVSTAILWLLIALRFAWSAIFETDLFVAGLIVGSVLALGAIGLTLIYGISASPTSRTETR